MKYLKSYTEFILEKHQTEGALLYESTLNLIAEAEMELELNEKDLSPAKKEALRKKLAKTKAAKKKLRAQVKKLRSKAKGNPDVKDKIAALRQKISEVDNAQTQLKSALGHNVKPSDAASASDQDSGKEKDNDKAKVEKLQAEWDKLNKEYQEAVSKKKEWAAEYRKDDEEFMDKIGLDFMEYRDSDFIELGGKVEDLLDKIDELQAKKQKIEAEKKKLSGESKPGAIGAVGGRFRQ